MSSKLFIILLAILVLFTAGIRGYGVLSSPPSLYWEEAAIGYDAYAILKTGRDHHGHAWPILAFESFGDWKPALYFYLVAAVESVVGLTPLAVRIPAMLSGIAVVVATAFLIKNLLGDRLNVERQRQFILITLLVGAVSPWGIMFSRAGWESMTATFLLAGGSVLWLFAKQFKHKLWMVILATLLLVLSAYTYHAARLIAPLLFLLLWVDFALPDPITYRNTFRQVKNNLKVLVAGLLVMGLLLLPFVISLKSDQISNRFNTTSIFADGSIVLESNQLRQVNNFSLISRLIYHRYVLSLYQVGQNLTSHFNLDYLFVSGDQNWRHSTQYFGQFYWLDFILMPLGVIWWWQKSKRKLFFLLGFLLICLLPSSLSTGAPHAVRTLASLPVWWLLVATGFYVGLSTVWRAMIKYPAIFRRVMVILVIFIYLGQFGWFYYHYLFIYPHNSAKSWQYGYYELFASLKKLELADSGRQFYVTREQGRPAMYYFFFNQVDPTLVQQFNNTAKKDQGEFLEFGQYHFVDDLASIQPGSIVAASPAKIKAQLPDATLIHNITSLDGSTIWQIVRL